MNQTIENLSRPGEEPEAGDKIRITKGKSVVTFVYYPQEEESDIKYLEEFTASQLRDSFTADEFIAALTSPIPEVVAQAQLLMTARTKMINKDEEGYISMVNGLEVAGVLTAELATEYLKGIPADRLPSPVFDQS